MQSKQNFYTMEKLDKIISMLGYMLVVAIWIAVLLLCAVLDSCTVARSTTATGTATIITTDTTVIHHDGVIEFKKSVIK